MGETSMPNCIKCGREVKVCKWGMVDGGSTDWIRPGYGSIHDLTAFKITLCDDCIGKLKVPQAEYDMATGEIYGET